MPPHKLFIPGPVEVSPGVFKAMSAPLMGHRSPSFQKLYAGLQPGLRSLFGTSGPVFLSTSSAWGVMEGAIRNLTSKKVLCCACGAFSDKWADVARRCGKQADELKVAWGEPITPQAIAAHLETNAYDTLTLVHSETSTGVLNPLPDIAALKTRFPDVMFVVDTVSSFSTMPLEFDKLGIDWLLTGSQKALALPPGLALFTVSPAAIARANTLEGRGYYFDLLEFLANHENDMTPSTPAISLLYGLEYQLKQIASEGLDQRYARHAMLNQTVHNWLYLNDFTIFAPPGYRSLGLTCVENNRGIDVPRLQEIMKNDHQFIIDGGYGKLKGKTFRLSNMGDETDSSIASLLSALDDSLKKLN